LDEISLDLPMVPGVDLLQRVPLFAKLGYEETLALAQISHIERRGDAELIIAQDSLGGALYILKEGRAAVRHRDQITSEVKELATLGRGELFGEMTLIDDQLASADVAALGAVELLVIPRKAFEDLLAGNERLAVKVYRCFCRALSDKLRKANSRITDLSKKAGA
jgi:CRP-like cAMP-binding protein